MNAPVQPRTEPGAVEADALAAALEASPMPMVLTDPRRPDNPIVWANASYCTLTGYGRDELYGRGWRLLEGPDSDPVVAGRIREAVASGDTLACELLNYRKDGTPFWNGLTLNPVRDEAGAVRYCFAAQADTSAKHALEAALTRANDELERQVGERTAALRAALEQKTALLHEVDHRVKNNLQVISSLMLLKARRTPAGAAHEALQAMADRIGALSSVYRLLYAAGDVTQFDFREFADDLLADMALGVEPKRIVLAAEIEPIRCSAAMAAPLALLLHELATNALRHAFPEGRSGRVAILARRSPAGMRLSVADDGVGLEAGPPNPTAFGRNLVEMVVRQLRGTVAWTDAAPGTRASVDIPLGPSP